MHLKSLTKLEYMSTPIKHENQEVMMFGTRDFFKIFEIMWKIRLLAGISDS